MVEYWKKPPLEGRALSRPATTKRGTPEPVSRLSPNIPKFPYSNIPG